MTSPIPIHEDGTRTLWIVIPHDKRWRVDQYRGTADRLLFHQPVVGLVGFRLWLVGVDCESKPP